MAYSFSLSFRINNKVFDDLTFTDKLIKACSCSIFHIYIFSYFILFP